jgi:hypothetical protein
MTNKYKVTDKNGKVHKRTSRDRVYTHAVVRHWDSYSYDLWNVVTPEEAAVMIASNAQLDLSYNPATRRLQRTMPAGSDASWCGRQDLANKQAGSDRKRNGVVDVEILLVTKS